MDSRSVVLIGVLVFVLRSVAIGFVNGFAVGVDIGLGCRCAG